MRQTAQITLEVTTNGDHFMFVFDVSTFASAYAAFMQHPQISPLLARFNACVAEENACLKLSQKSFLSDDLKAMDDLRDKVYLGYKHSVEAFIDFPVEELASSAKLLNQHIKDYGIDPRMQRDRESGLMLNFVDDLEKKYATEVQKLNLTLFVEQMKKANDAYIAYSSQRTEERSKQTTGALANARKQTDAAYREFIRMVNAVALVEGDAAYAGFIDYTNELIRHYKQEVMNQSTSSPASGSTTTPDDGQGDTTTPDTGDGTEQPGEGTEPTPDSGEGGTTDGGGSSSGYEDEEDEGLAG